jgi:hypothetical protein
MKSGALQRQRREQHLVGHLWIRMKSGALQ